MTTNCRLADSTRPAFEVLDSGHDNAPRYNLKQLNSAAFRRTTAIVRYRSDIPNETNFNTNRLNRAHRRLSARTRTLNADLATLHTDFACSLRRANAGLLRREGGAFARAVKPKRARGRLTDKITLKIRYGYQRIVKARLNVDDALGYHSPLFTLEGLLLPRRLCLSFCHNPRDSDS